MMASAKKIIKRDVLVGILKGSYEETSRLLSESLINRYGDGISVFSTYPNKVVFYCENNGLMECKYRFGNNGEIILGSNVSNIDSLCEDDVVSKSVDSFYKSGSMRGSLSLVADIDYDVSKLFGSRIWKDYVCSDSRGSIVEYTKDNYLFSIPSIVESICDSKSVDSKSVDSKSVDSLLGNISSIHDDVLSSMKSYHDVMEYCVDEEYNTVLSKFESISGDYLEYIGAIVEKINNTDNIKVLNKIYECVLVEYSDIHLGHRFIRKMSKQLEGLGEQK